MSAATVADAAGRPARVPVIVQRIALALLLLGAWWLISLAVPPYVLPPPGRVFARIVQLTQSGDLPINLLTTLGRVLAGFALAVALGVPGGILLGSHRALGTFFEPVLPVLRRRGDDGGTEVGRISQRGGHGGAEHREQAEGAQGVGGDAAAQRRPVDRPASPADRQRGEGQRRTRPHGVCRVGDRHGEDGERERRAAGRRPGRPRDG